jgi:hypothetical protein
VLPDRLAGSKRPNRIGLTRAEEVTPRVRRDTLQTSPAGMPVDFTTGGGGVRRRPNAEPWTGLEMTSSLFPDPLQMWRDAVTRLENDVNALATDSMKSQEVARSLNQFSAVSLGMQQIFEKVVDGYLRRANLPSRKEVAELAQALERIEAKLDRLLPADALAAPERRPARTRRPPGAVAAQEPAPPAAPKPKPEPAATRTARRGARRARA